MVASIILFNFIDVIVYMFDLTSIFANSVNIFINVFTLVISLEVSFELIGISYITTNINLRREDCRVTVFHFYLIGFSIINIIKVL
jgi:hypothetical protein